MIFHNSRHLETVLQYQGVYKVEILKNCTNDKYAGIRYVAKIMINSRRYCSKYYLTSREAALWYDMKRIESGLLPVNILKRRLNNL